MAGMSKCLFFLSTSAYLVAGFDWKSITPSTKLAYSPCYHQFQCARLLLPLDWLNENGTDTVSIAIIKLPAAVPQDDPTFGGAIFTNPGGPGGSGTKFLVGSARGLQSIIDIPGQKHYEYISFDPRGVGESEPWIDCYPLNHLGRTAQELERFASGSLNLSPASFTFGHYKARAFGRRCEMTNAKMLPFVNTRSVARDMVAMVDKVAELRQEQAGQHQDTDTQFELRETKDDQVPRLQFLGFSYGTVLGNYFASLFPERVGRMVLDGVVDSEDFSNGPGWLTSTQDADEMMEMFFEGCFNASHMPCGLRQPGDKTPADISKRTWSWIKARDSDPIEVMSPDRSTDILLRSGDIRLFLFLALYGADYNFFKLAHVLGEAVDGRPELLTRALLDMHGMSNLNNGCRIGDDSMAIVRGMTAEPMSAVACTDGDDVSSQNSTYWKGYMEKQLSISPIFGDILTEARMNCAAWRVRPNWSFKGPFKTPAPSKDPSAPEPGHPAAPLLFLSSKWDPVTPLRNARAMAERHPGAGLLVTESMGHCAIGSGRVGACTSKVVSEYFDKGVVPKEEVFCKRVKDPWGVVTAQDLRVQELMRKRTRFNLLGV